MVLAEGRGEQVGREGTGDVGSDDEEGGDAAETLERGARSAKFVEPEEQSIGLRPTVLSPSHKDSTAKQRFHGELGGGLIFS